MDIAPLFVLFNGFNIRIPIRIQFELFECSIERLYFKVTINLQWRSVPLLVYLITSAEFPPYSIKWNWTQMLLKFEI